MNKTSSSNNKMSRLFSRVGPIVGVIPFLFVVSACEPIEDRLANMETDLCISAGTVARSRFGTGLSGYDADTSLCRIVSGDRKSLDGVFVVEGKIVAMRQQAKARERVLGKTISIPFNATVVAKNGDAERVIAVRRGTYEP